MTGVTVLKDGRFKKRYTGSKTAAVDINGQLYLKAADLQKIVSDGGKPGKVPAKKKRSVSAFLDPVPEQATPDPGTRAKTYKINKTEVRNRIHGMLNTGRGKKELYFWTITFPQGTADDVIYRLFNTWLTTCRQKKWLREYLWICERQQNGTIHFHLAIPHKMSVNLANNAMRTTLRTAALKKEIPFNVYQCRRYNGIDIAKNRKTRRVTNFAIKKGSRSLSYYLTKYCTKNNSTFNHLAWHNSRGFSALFTGITFTVPEFLGYGFRQLVKPSAVVKNEYFLFFAWVDDPPFAVVKHLHELNSYIQEQNNILPQLN
jgi:hypothetical protein